MVKSLTAEPYRPLGRMTARLIAEMQLSCAAQSLTLFRGKFDPAIVFLVVLRADAWLQTRSTGVVVQATAPPGGISVNAIAQSLGRPFESVRRYVNALIADGLCLRSPHGIVVNPVALETPDVIVLLDALHDAMVRLIEHLTAFGVALPANRQNVPYDKGATIAVAIDIFVSFFEFLGAGISWTRATIVGAVAAANVREVTFNPVLAFRYGEESNPVPELLRKPVSAAAICRGLGLAPSSVHRHVTVARARGVLTVRDGKLLTSTDYLSAPWVLAVARLVTTQAIRAMSRLGPAGFPFDDPGACYIRGCPPLVPFA